ncbi:hypothetical protein WN51_01651, partial [Melipona quadrifasciata]
RKQGSWGGRGGGGGGVVVGSPGVGGTSNSSSSSGASWRSGTPSPPLSDEGAPTTGSLWPTSAHPSHNQQHYPYNASGSSSSSTPGSTTTLDEGIVPDYLEEQHPRKKKIRAKVSRDPIENGPANTAIYESEQYIKYSHQRTAACGLHSQVTLRRGKVEVGAKISARKSTDWSITSKQLCYETRVISASEEDSLHTFYDILTSL